VDNGSNDGSIDFVIRNYPEVKTIALSKNVGFSVANNIAIKTVKTEYVALLNNDAVAHPLWLQRV
jgi:GT2 family glycosyltransferase